MKNNLLLYISLAVSIILAVLHILAIELYLYWFYWWFDILTHFLGGAWVAITAVWLLKKKLLIPYENFLIIFISVIALSFFWEIFELFLWEYLRESNYLFDTILDTASALTGGLTIFILLKFYLQDEEI